MRLLKVSEASQDGFDGLVGIREHRNEVLSSDGAVDWVQQVPPPHKCNPRLLGCLAVLISTLDQAIDSSLNSVVRNG
jgi:hypothetical protein